MPKSPKPELKPAPDPEVSDRARAAAIVREALELTASLPQKKKK